MERQLYGGRWLGGTLAGRTSLEFGVRWRSACIGCCNGSFSHPLFLFDFWLWWVFVAAVVFSSCGEQVLLFVALCQLLIVVVFAVEHGLQCEQASVVVAEQALGRSSVGRTGLVAPQHVGFPQSCCYCSVSQSRLDLQPID